MNLVSVIIPVYNTGCYLKKCIYSICDQTYKNLQIIIVDDGSNGETSKLCDELAIQDSRIEVIHKKNEGVSIARNTGLTIAKGDVLTFVDSDDTIQPDMIKRLVDTLNEKDVDIAMCDASTIKPDRPVEPDTIPVLTDSCILNTKDITPAMLILLAGSAWRCAYRRTDMLAKQAKFPMGIKFSEDRIFNIIAMGLANKIAYIKESYYNRLIREGSACFRFYPEMTEQISKMRGVMLDTVKKFWGEKYLSAYETQIAGQIRYAVTNYTAPSNGLTLSQKITSIKNLCKNPDILQCIKNCGSSDVRSRMIINGNYLLLTMFGILINRYHKICKIGQYQQ